MWSYRLANSSRFPLRKNVLYRRIPPCNQTTPSHPLLLGIIGGFYYGKVAHHYPTTPRVAVPLLLFLLKLPFYALVEFSCQLFPELPQALN
jgi:hypothetical protein